MNLKTVFAASTLLSNPGHAKEINWDAFSSSALIEVRRDNQLFTSSAVVIKRNVLLTAAHSVEDIDEGFIHLGMSYDKSNKKIAFKKVIIHSGYNKAHSNYKNDIAVIILESNLPESIKPIALAQHKSELNAPVDRIGFGGRNGKNLRTWTNPTVVGKEEGTLILNDQLSVIGDSGGPLYSDNKLIGIHSTLEGQNKTYAVYVPNYLHWINEQLPLKEITL